MMFYLLCLSLIFGVSYSALGPLAVGDARVTVHCDNHGKIEYSHNGGPRVKVAERVITEYHLLWKEPLEGDIPYYCPFTKIYVTCDDLHVVGAMIGQVEFRGVVYYTTNPLSASDWSVVSSTAGSIAPSSLVYTVNGAGPWGNVALLSGINPAAYWVWNGEIKNSMEFEFCWPLGLVYAKSEIAQKIDGGKEVIATSSSGYNSLYGIIGFAAFMVFILINNIFICWYCLCHRKGGEKEEKSQYESVKMIQEDDNA